MLAGPTGDFLLLLGALALPVLSGGAAALFLRRRHPDAAVGKGALVVGNGLVLLFILSSLFLASECYYRFFYDATVGNNLTKVSQRWFQRHWTLNANGYRDDVDYLRQKAPGRRRVTFFGDSFTAGHGVSDVRDRFANRIRSTRSDWEIHVVARNGMDSVHQLEQLQRLHEEGYDLDVVVLVYLFNDISPFVPDLGRVFEHWQRGPEHLGFLVDHSFAANFYYSNWKRATARPEENVKDYEAVIDGAYATDAWYRQKRVLRQFAQTVRDAGGRLVVVVFPELSTLVRGDTAFQVMHRKLEDLWGELSVLHLDLRPLFEEHRGSDLVVSPYDAHPSPLSHELAAKAIEGFLGDVLAGMEAPETH